MSPTCFAVLTGEGPGAIAVVRVWGDEAVSLVDASFRPLRGPRLAETGPARPRVGRFGAGVGDEVVTLIAPGTPSEVEIQPHGGPAAVALVAEALVKSGAVRSSVRRWVRASSPSSTIADARLALPLASTVRTAAILLDQAGGALDRALEAIRALAATDPGQTIDAVDALLKHARVGAHLVSDWRVALAGRPNVGKSRLLNALAGHDRAIVAPTSGTTRDVVTARLAVDGWPISLEDTAGLREADDPIEAAGVALARATHDEADLVLLVLDRSQPLTPADRALIDADPDALIVANKADLPAAWEPDSSAVVVSADRGDGIDRLAAEIARRLVPTPPPPGAAVPFRPSHGRLIVDVMFGGRPDRASRRLARWVGRPKPNRSGAADE